MATIGAVKYSSAKVLVRLAIASAPAIYHRWALGRQDVHIGSGSYAGHYKALVASDCTIDEEIQAKPDFPIAFPEFTLEISRTDTDRDTVDDLITDIRDNATETSVLYVYISSGGSLAAADCVFTGRVERDDVEITAQRVTFRVGSYLSQYDKNEIPNTKHSFAKDTGDYEKIGEYIPIMLGSWTDKASEYELPCTIVERRTEIAVGAHRIQVQLCEPGDDGILHMYQPVWWRGSSGDDHGFQIWGGRYTAYSRDDDEGTYTLMLSRAQDAGSQVNVWQKGDTAHIIAATGNVNSSGNLIEDPVDLIYHLMTCENYGPDNSSASVPTTFIGDSITPGSGSQVSTDFKFRAFLRKPRKLITEVIADICRDALLVLYIKDNKFEVAKNPLLDWDADYDSGYGSYDSVEINNNMILDTQRHTLLARDLRYNGVKFCYKKHPETDEYQENFRLGSEPFYKIESDWIWREMDARVVAGYYYKMFTTGVETLEFTLPLQGLDIELRDIIEYTGDGLDDEAYYVMQNVRDLAGMEGRIKCLRRALRTYRATYTSNTQTVYSHPSTTDEDKRVCGWYTDTDGEVDGDAGMSDMFNNES